MYNKETAIRKFTREGKEVKKEVVVVSGLGNFTADAPEVKEVEVGKDKNKTSVIGEFGFSVAFNQGKDKPAQFYRLEAWGKTAELLSRFAKKGLEAYFFGRVDTRSYTNKENEEVSYEVLVVELFKLSKGQLTNNNEQTTEQTTSEEVPEGFETNSDDFEEFDDIPF